MKQLTVFGESIDLIKTHIVGQLVEYYLYLTDNTEKNYKRHLKAAKQLLELCDGDIEKAKQMLDKTKEWMDSWGGEDLKIETVFRRYPFMINQK